MANQGSRYTYHTQNGIVILGDILLRPLVIRFRRSGSNPEVPPPPRTPTPLAVAPNGSGEPDGGQLPRGAGARERPRQCRERVGEQRRREEGRSHWLPDLECGDLQQDRTRTRKRAGGGDWFAFLCGKAATNSSGSGLTGVCFCKLDLAETHIYSKEYSAIWQKHVHYFFPF